MPGPPFVGCTERRPDSGLRAVANDHGMSPRECWTRGGAYESYEGVQTAAGVVTPSPENGSSWGTSSSQYPYLAASSRSIAAMSGVLW